MKKTSFFLVCFWVFLFAVFFSCTSLKNVIYLNDLRDSTLGRLPNPVLKFETPIQINDQLSIVVGGTNLQDLAMLNSAAGNSNLASANFYQSTGTTSIGYFVEADGNILLPFVGKIKVTGLTRIQLQDTLSSLLKDYTKNPVVNVRFLNYNFSVLGEVRQPGRKAMINERTTLLDAISLSGDLTEFGRSNNILIIREDSGRRIYGRVNLLSKKSFESPYFYLKTNDIVYVEPMRSKFISRGGIPQYISIAAVGLSLILTILNLTK